MTKSIQTGDELINFIVERRRELGLSQFKLEDATGILQPQISRIETRRVDPRLSSVLKLLNSMGLTLVVTSKGEV